MKPEEIVDALNECAAKIENAGDWIIDCVIDMREDEGLPPLTPEELAAEKKKCDAVADKVIALESKMDDLRAEYFSVTGDYPHYNEATNRYSVRLTHW